VAFLLKIDRHNFEIVGTLVSKLKSAKYPSATDIGSEVYVWFPDQPGSPSSLSLRANILTISESQVSQKRDPSKSKPAYLLSFDEPDVNLVSRLTTDDLQLARYDDNSEEYATLGKLHRDRNEKIIRLSGVEREILASHFA